MRTNDRELTFHVFCKEAQECGSRISSGVEEALFHVFSKMSLEREERKRRRREREESDKSGDRTYGGSAQPAHPPRR